MNGLIVDDLQAESDALDALVAGLEPEQWRRPTPAPGWTIAHQIGHLWWTDRVALMSITDELVPRYFRLCSTLSIDEIDQIDAAFADGTADPYQLKRQLARNICDLYHGEGAGEKAQEAFDALFKHNEVPDDIPEFSVDLSPRDDGTVYLAGVMVECGLAQSAGEARRLIDGGGVKVNGDAVAAKSYNVDPALLKGATVQVGKRKFAKLV